MTSPTSFRYEETNGVAAIRFDRPDRLNSLTFQVYRELTDTFRGLASRSDVRAEIQRLVIAREELRR